MIIRSVAYSSLLIRIFWLKDIYLLSVNWLCLFGFWLIRYCKLFCCAISFRSWSCVVRVLPRSYCEGYVGLVVCCLLFLEPFQVFNLRSSLVVYDRRSNIGLACRPLEFHWLLREGRFLLCCICSLCNEMFVARVCKKAVWMPYCSIPGFWFELIQSPPYFLVSNPRKRTT